MIKILNSAEAWMRPHIGDAVIRSKDGRSSIKVRLFGLQHPECSIEHDWLKVAIEFSSWGHICRFTDFEFNRRGLQSSIEALSRLESFVGASNEILSNYSGFQTLRCEMGRRALFLKLELRLGDGKMKAQFETTLPEIYRFRKQMERFGILFPSTDVKLDLDFVAALRGSMSCGLEPRDVHSWILQVITSHVGLVEKRLLKSVDRHLRRRSRKNRERSDVESFRLRKFARHFSVSKALNGDVELIAYFESISK